MVYGVEAPVNILMDANGIEMSVAGTKTKIFGSWETVAKALYTPGNVPSFLEGHPFEFLKHQALTSKKKKAKKKEAGNDL